MKGSVALSLYFLVGLIIALAVMGLVIGWTFSKFNSSSEYLEIHQETIVATPNSPINLPGSVNTLFLSKAKPNVFEVSVYNKGDDASTLDLELRCNPSVEHTLTTVEHSIPRGTSFGIPISLVFDKSESFGSKNCLLVFGESTKVVTLEVR